MPYDIICLWYDMHHIIWMYIRYHILCHMISYVSDIILDVYVWYHVYGAMISFVSMYEIICIWYHMFHWWYHIGHIIYDIIWHITDITRWCLISYVPSTMSDVSGPCIEDLRWFQPLISSLRHARSLQSPAYTVAPCYEAQYAVTMIHNTVCSLESDWRPSRIRAEKRKNSFVTTPC